MKVCPQTSVLLLKGVEGRGMLLFKKFMVYPIHYGMLYLQENNKINLLSIKVCDFICILYTRVVDIYEE